MTGAASGIGLATVRGLAEAGAAVAVLDVDENAARSAVEELVSSGRRVVAIRCDVPDEHFVAAAVQQIITRFGRLDIAFNNAGIHAPVAQTADGLVEDFDRVISINLEADSPSLFDRVQADRGHDGSPASRAGLRS